MVVEDEVEAATNVNIMVQPPLTQRSILRFYVISVGSPDTSRQTALPTLIHPVLLQPALGKTNAHVQEALHVDTSLLPKRGKLPVIAEVGAMRWSAWLVVYLRSTP